MPLNCDDKFSCEKLNEVVQEVATNATSAQNSANNAEIKAIEAHNSANDANTKAIEAMLEADKARREANRAQAIADGIQVQNGDLVIQYPEATAGQQEFPYPHAKILLAQTSTGNRIKIDENIKDKIKIKDNDYIPQDGEVLIFLYFT